MPVIFMKEETVYIMLRKVEVTQLHAGCTQGYFSAAARRVPGFWLHSYYTVWRVV